jgi:transcriptional regulator GlxA family with amidase domain
VVYVPNNRVRQNQSLHLAIQLMLAEAANDGLRVVAARVFDCAFTLLLEEWIGFHSPGKTLGAGGLRDKGIASALAAMRQNPSHAWTVASLAAVAAQSRATFARRFTRLVGEPPLSYLSRWRINLAARALRETKQSVEQVSESVGYRSVSSFTKAFIRSAGQPPSSYRKNRVTPD